MSEANGHIKLEDFKTKANRLRSVPSLEKLWTEFGALLPPDAVKVREKAQRVYDRRKVELEKTTKEKAHEVIQTDTHITRKCLIGKIGCAVLSSYLNAQAAVLGMKKLLATSPQLKESLETTYFPGTGWNFLGITEVAAFVYGLVIPFMVLLLWAVAGHMYLRGRRKKIAAYTFLAGTALLLLSVWHCTESLCLFGLPTFMAFLYALGIDYGLISFEISSVFSHAPAEENPTATAK